MTTKAAAQHRYEHEGVPYALYNPNNVPLSQLPVVYGFNNGGSPGWLSAVALAEDGTCLGGHCCSHEGYMEYDLGVIAGSRPDRHENDYKKHFPNGYRMDFVPYAEIDSHAGLKKALTLANAKPPAAPPEE